MNKNETGCLAALVVLTFLPLSIVLNAHAAMLNWNWFAPAIGLPRISFWEAQGLVVLVTCFSRASASSDSKDEDLGTRIRDAVISIVVRYACLIGMGYAVHAWFLT